MPKIIQAESPVLAAVTDRIRYVGARFQAEELAKEYGLALADMPLLIQAMKNHPKVRGAIRPKWADTITGEYHGKREGDRSYEVWHSVGSLTTPEGLKKAFSDIADYDFMPILGAEWIAVGKGGADGHSVVRVHLEDAKKGNVPTPGTPYCISVRLDKDPFTIHHSWKLNYDSFMSDDRVLMITGSPDCREALAKMLFGKKEDGGEDRTSVGSDHSINDLEFSKKPKGRLVYLGSRNLGPSGDRGDNYNGRFVVVGAGGAVVAKHSTPQIITGLPLEVIIDILDNPELNRAGMIEAAKAYRS